MRVEMPFGVKNGPPTYQKVVTKMFHEYIDVFIKIFLDDFTVFNDRLTHLEKFKKCFLKCREFGISLNPYKCAFMVFSRTTLGFIVSKEGKVMNPKKVEALVNMPIPTTPKEIQVFNGMAQFCRCLIKNFAFYYVISHQTIQEVKLFNGLQNAKMLGRRLKISFVTSCNQNMCQLYYKNCIMELEEDIFSWTFL